MQGQLVTAKFKSITDRQNRQFWKQTEGSNGKPPLIHRANFQRFIDCPEGFGVRPIVPLHDMAVPEPLRPTTAKIRTMMAEKFELVDPAISVVYRVFAGITLKHNVPQFGPCVDSLRYLQDWQFDDEATIDSYVFCIPRLVPGSTRKNVEAQRALLAAFRKQYELPEHFFSGFGDASLVASIMQSHKQRTGEKTPLDGYWARTDTLTVGGIRLSLGWREGGLYCDDWHDGGDVRGRLGCLALGVQVFELSGA